MSDTEFIAWTVDLLEWLDPDVSRRHQVRRRADERIKHLDPAQQEEVRQRVLRSFKNMEQAAVMQLIERLWGEWADALELRDSDIEWYPFDLTEGATQSDTPTEPAKIYPALAKMADMKQDDLIQVLDLVTGYQPLRPLPSPNPAAPQAAMMIQYIDRTKRIDPPEVLRRFYRSA